MAHHCIHGMLFSNSRQDVEAFVAIFPLLICVFREQSKRTQPKTTGLEKFIDVRLIHIPVDCRRLHVPELGHLNFFQTLGGLFIRTQEVFLIFRDL